MDFMWYVISVKTNCEKKVQADLLQMVRNYGLSDEIMNVLVPETEELVLKKGVPTTVRTVKLKGYVYIKCRMSNDIWYKVRNSSRNIYGFLGADSANPSPLKEKEAETLEAYCEPKAAPFSMKEKDECIITNGAWQNSRGVVTEIDHSGKKVIVEVELFQRKVPVVLSFAEVKRTS